VFFWNLSTVRRLDEILALPYADRVEVMIRLPALSLAGCVICAGLILIEFGSISNHRPSSGVRFPAEIQPAAPENQKLGDAPLNPKQRRPETPSSPHDTGSPLRDVRLTGVVIGPDVRIAIFAVAGASPLVLSEGDALKDWRLDSISSKGVVLSGPAGNMALEPKSDPNLVRPPPPASLQSDQLQPGIPSGVGLADAPRQPMVVTPIVVGNFPAATPVQAQGYPYYFPEYYTGYDPYYPSYDDYPFLFSYPSLLYAVPTSAGFRFRFFHHYNVHRGGFFRGGFLHSVVFHGGGFHGGGRGGRR
jgi:hypothetical protein